jgi:hypothetical protein
MHRLRVSLDRPLHRDGDPFDDGPLPDFDGDDRDSLLSRASLRLLALKRASKAPARVYG